MLAQDSYDAARPIRHKVVKKRKRSLFSVVVKSQIARILIVAAAACIIAKVYVGAYAGNQEKGYQKSDLSIRLRQIRLENDRLRLELDRLRQPDAITQFAISNGMKQSDEMAYLDPPNQPNIAQNTDR